MKWILNKITIKNQLVLSVLLICIFILIMSNIMYSFRSNCWDMCDNIINNLASISIIGVATVLQAILLFIKKSQQLFTHWKKHLVVYFVVYFVLYCIVPMNDNSLFLGIEKIPALFSFSILFVLISLPLLLYKSFKK